MTVRIRLIGTFFFVDKIDIIIPFIETGEWMCGPFADKEGKIHHCIAGPCPIEEAPFIHYFYGMEGYLWTQGILGWH